METSSGFFAGIYGIFGLVGKILVVLGAILLIALIILYCVQGYLLCLGERYQERIEEGILIQQPLNPADRGMKYEDVWITTAD